ncbi:MAG TPA: metallophosphoesterase [Thermoplasmata archaeon]|nr:metallophosphoesterase [Thermoplasmata archaeon]
MVPRDASTSPAIPIEGTPFLSIGSGRSRLLLLADLHLGLGGTERWATGPPEGAWLGQAEGIERAARSVRARTIVLAGDVKHPIVGTPRPLRPIVFDFFAHLLSGGFSVEVVLGNHDVGLVRHLPKEVGVHPTSGAVFGPVGVFHGHRWPSEPVRRAPMLVAGHLHPGYRLAPSADERIGKERCWVRVTFPDRASAPKRRRARHDFDAREMIVLPAANPLAGCEPLNLGRPKRSRSFLFHRFLARGAARAYLLDGTDLGPIATSDPDAPRS